MSRLFYVLLWLALPVAVCVWAVAHGQESGRFFWSNGKCAVWSHGECRLARPNVPGAVLTDDVRRICRRGYSASVRPPESYTKDAKRELLRELPNGMTRFRQSYELDHLAPICVGGDPESPANLWLEPIGEAHAKDREEARICREVCAGRIDIHDAQKYFLNWPDGTLQ